MVEHFPPIDRSGAEDRNPAVQLFGRRFFTDQTAAELLVEFFLVACSEKRVGDVQLSPRDSFPELEVLHHWNHKAPLEYSSSAHLNLKLFAFLGASKLETRHLTHRQHYHDLLAMMESPEHLSVGETVDRRKVLQALENLFLGFQGAGGSRTWCAKSFLPVVPELLSKESIWQQTKAARQGVLDWDEALSCFSQTQHVFLARGGELLYLQVCNALRQSADDVVEWSNQNGLSLAEHERVPNELRRSLVQGLESVFDSCPATLGGLAEFIDGLETETAKKIDGSQGDARFSPCGWCPTESWPEALLFAVELQRLFDAVIDPVERIELLEVCCAMQVLRSLCAQSARYVDWAQERKSAAGPLSYVWAVSDSSGQNRVTKQISKRSVNAIQRLIREAIRTPEIAKVVEQQETQQDPYKEADERYGHKLFTSIAKKLGLIIPKRGQGARFVLNDRILRFLVMSVIRPGERVTYDTFKKLIYAHHGIAVDDGKIGSACTWIGTNKLTTLGGNADQWLVDMLDASGVLIKLSDSCSQVMNPFDSRREAE